jgi:cell division protein FtsB
MKILSGVLVALIVLIQYPLWLGKGSWLRAWEVERQLTAQRAKNSQLEVRNSGFAAEVGDLKQGTEAIEERARYELGMVRQDEVFFQFQETRGQTLTPPALASGDQSATSGSKKSH